MITVRYSRADGDVQLSVTGHAERAAKGEDVVCAAVSTAVQGAILTLIAIAQQHPDAVAVHDVTPAPPPGERAV